MNLTSENPIPQEPASGAQVNLTPWQEPDVGEPKYDPSSVTNPLERGEGAAAQDSLAPLRSGIGAKVGGEVAEGAEDVAEGAAEDVAAPELALAAPVLGAVAEADIPVLSTVARGVEDVGTDIEKGVEDIFGGESEAAPKPTPQPVTAEPTAGDPRS